MKFFKQLKVSQPRDLGKIISRESLHLHKIFSIIKVKDSQSQKDRGWEDEKHLRYH
jgi:hypothetical protein